MMLRSLGAGGVLVVVVSVAGALSLAPALLSVLGHRVNSLTVLHGSAPASGNGLWHRVASMVARRPLAVFLGVLALLLLLGLPFLRVRMGAPDITILPKDVESRQGFDLLRQEFGAGEVAPIFVVVEAQDSIFRQEHVGSLYDFSRALEALPGVVRVESLVNLDPAITRGQYQLLYAEPGRISDPAVLRSLNDKAKKRG